MSGGSSAPLTLPSEANYIGFWCDFDSILISFNFFFFESIWKLIGIIWVIDRSYLGDSKKCPVTVADLKTLPNQLNELMKAYKENEEARDQFLSKNPDAKAARGKRSEKEVMSVVEGDEGSKNEVVSGEHASLFDGPDLALQRKMERDAKKKEDSSS